MSTRLYIEHINSDVYIIRVNEHEILDVNHDDDGRSGMARIHQLVLDLGTIFGFDVIETDTPEDEDE